MKIMYRHKYLYYKADSSISVRILDDVKGKTKKVHGRKYTFRNFIVVQVIW